MINAKYGKSQMDWCCESFTRRKCSKSSLIDSRYSRPLAIVVDRRGGKRAS